MASYAFHDAHFHLTNYLQEGPPIGEFVRMMGTTIGRSTLFGIPLQQSWSSGRADEPASSYYLQTDAPLSYYSFTDAAIAMAYRSLPSRVRGRLDPVITGFNPTDLHAVDHIRRVLLTFPGVFSGIGQFPPDSESVSSRATGDSTPPPNPAVDRILEFAGEVGLVTIMHNDGDAPLLQRAQGPWTVLELRDRLKRHRRTAIIWAHVGLRQAVRSFDDQVASIEQTLQHPDLSHVCFDLSWDEITSYAVATPGTTARIAGIINRFPDRFLFGTDVVAPASLHAMTAAYRMYDPIWKLLTPDVSHKVRLGNYERLFDAARRDVRAWECRQTADRLIAGVSTSGRRRTLVHPGHTARRRSSPASV